MKLLTTIILGLASSLIVNAAPSPTGTGQAQISLSVTPSPAIEGEILTVQAIVYSANGAVPAPNGDVAFFGEYVDTVTLQSKTIDIGTGTITTNSAGTTSLTLDTTGLGGQLVSFKAHYLPPSPPPGQGFGSVFSASIPVYIAPATVTCTGFTIAADLAAGSGNPVVNQSGNWSYKIKLRACSAVSNVTAQGGTSGWLTLATTGALVPSKGTVAVRKQNNKTAVVLWTVGNMAAGEEAELLVNMTGTVPKGSSGTVQYISGPWSAITTSTDEVPVTSKTEYTDRVSVTVQ